MLEIVDPDVFSILNVTVPGAQSDEPGCMYNAPLFNEYIPPVVTPPAVFPLV
jgi:hypothetical protein